MTDWKYTRDRLPGGFTMGVCMWPTTWICYCGSIHVTDYLEMLLSGYIRD